MDVWNKRTNHKISKTGIPKLNLSGNYKRENGFNFMFNEGTLNKKKDFDTLN